MLPIRLNPILSLTNDVHAPLPITNLVRDNILKSLARGENNQHCCVSSHANCTATEMNWMERT